MASARKSWVKIKDDSKRAGLDVMKVVGRSGFGDLLDKMEEKRLAVVALEKKQPVDAAKLKAAVTACQEAQQKAHTLCQGIARAFVDVANHSAEPTKSRANEVSGELMGMLDLIKNYRTRGGA